MVDVARLGLAVDSTQVEKGTVSLHQLTGAAGQASAAARQLAGASQVETVGQKAATVAVQAHNAALMAQNTVMRSSMQQRTMMIYQLNDVAVSLASGMNPAMVAMQQGSQILQGGLGPALRTIGDLAKNLVTRFWPLAAVVGAVGVAVAGLTHEINKSAEVQVSFFDVVQAGWSLMAEKIGSVLSPLWDAIVGGLQWVWDQMAPILKNIGNGIIAPFAFGVSAIGTLWSRLPAAIGDATITTANIVVKGVEWSINKAAELLDGLISKANEGLGQFGVAIPTLGRVNFGGAANPYAGALGQLGSDLNQNNSDAYTTDYMGNMFGALSGRAQEIAAARKEMDALGGSTKAANDNVKQLANDGLQSIADKSFNVLAELGKAFEGIGSGLYQTLKKGGDAFDYLLGKVEQFAMSWLDNIVNNGISSFLGMFGNSAGLGWGVAGGFGGRGIFGIPGMAEGGTVGRAGLSWVGEQGPELLRLPAGAQVIPNGPSMAMAANSNTPRTVINVINNSGAQVDRRQYQQDGMDVTDIIIGTVKGGLTDGALDGAMKAGYGNKPRMRRV
jgi:hypothetical protein